MSLLVTDFLLSDGFGGVLRCEALAALMLTGAIGEFDQTLSLTNRHHLRPTNIDVRD
ncbi:hypothetical protein [Sphingorhabdus sp. EL138]|uniref:hypothetical protein n=1 Tax=Sphingorhabdus sp. EL138 TaxID=2073156 RepID=UPI0013A545C6|nr:hypothetical protein [Sphingorhabdus sp. EL138]